MNPKDYFEKNQLELVYRTTLLEGKIATLLTTKEVLTYGRSNSLGRVEVKVILNIRKAWKYILETNMRNGLDYLVEINEIITEDTLNNFMLEGSIRVSRVTISGTWYVPEVRDYTTSVNYLNFLFSKVDIKNVSSLLSLYVYLMKEQFFNDGNKRTAYIFINSLLMKLGFVLWLPKDSNNTIWLNKLKNFYEDSSTLEDIVGYLKKNYIRRM